MATYNSFTFGTVNSADFGIYIGGEGTFNAPERRGEMITIPGKNGALFLDEGAFENIELTYPAFNYEEDLETFRTKLAGLRNALCSQIGYQRLTDTFHPDEYRLAVFKSGLDVSPIKYNTASEFNIVFDCKPQRFLIDGDEPYSFIISWDGLTDENGEQLQTEADEDIFGGIGLGNNIVNPTPFEAKPLLMITGSGNVSIGSQIISVMDISNSTTIYIDCETMEIYTLEGVVATSASSHVSFNGNDFPVIPVGSSGVTYTTQRIEIIPRWWRI